MVLHSFIHVIALYRMVLHGIALLASARGLYLARHLSTLLTSIYQYEKFKENQVEFLLFCYMKNSFDIIYIYIYIISNEFFM